MKLELKRFNINTINDDNVVVLIGKRGTGKSFLVKDLLYFHTDLPIGTVVSGTESANRFYGDFVPNAFIHDEVDPQLVQNIITRQKIVMKKKNKEQKTYGTSRIDPRAFIILDDCLYDNSWAKDKNIRSIFMNGRHLKLFFIITMQYPLGIPPNLRTNIDYVFILRENIVANRKRIFENYAGMFPSFEVFSQVMDQCTENHECLVINNTSSSNKLEDCVFWYKGEKRDTYQLGSKQFWINNYDDDEDNSDEEYNPDEFGSKKNRPKINVKKYS
jgi:hypothetical protein|tara:strand:+ start:352 stop:1170 length:819 start_codon:yes stop_codon:yes gene_type:complete